MSFGFAALPAASTAASERCMAQAIYAQQARTPGFSAYEAPTFIFVFIHP
jgi:hypothetical protein